MAEIAVINLIATTVSPDRFENKNLVLSAA
jgi:hypothetical protein